MEDFETFYSKPLDIKVKELPNHPLKENVSVGNFKLIEKINTNNLTTGEDLNYEFEILGEDKKSANYTIVNSKVIPDDGDPEIVIDWRIYTKNPDKPLIRDLIVEGLSLARTQKEEFASILSSNNNDIKVLVNKLDEFTSN